MFSGRMRASASDASNGWRRRYAFGPEVHVLDGGTQGLYLLPFLEGTRNLLVFDAVDYGLPPAR
jgi:Ni,Fe-hydrogenase maturation factor